MRSVPDLRREVKNMMQKEVIKIIEDMVNQLMMVSTRM
jgi:hypothetical protein